MTSSNMFIEDYTPKSFIVRGDDTVNYKDSLTNMGGKWNSRLTDKVSGEKFGAWIFWSDKRVEITKWMVNKSKVTPKVVSTSRLGITTPRDGAPTPRDGDDRLANIEALLGELVLVIQKMNPSCKEALSKTKFYQSRDISSDVEDDEEVEDAPPPRRLLRK